MAEITWSYGINCVSVCNGICLSILTWVVKLAFFSSLVCDSIQWCCIRNFTLDPDFSLRLYPQSKLAGVLLSVFLHFLTNTAFHRSAIKFQCWVVCVRELRLNRISLQFDVTFVDTKYLQHPCVAEAEFLPKANEFGRSAINNQFGRPSVTAFSLSITFNANVVSNIHNFIFSLFPCKE